jgi:hypothetical protein
MTENTEAVIAATGSKEAVWKQVLTKLSIFSHGVNIMQDKLQRKDRQ